MVQPPLVRVTFFAPGVIVRGVRFPTVTVTLPLNPLRLPSETATFPELPGARITVSGVRLIPKSLNPTVMEIVAV